MQILVFNVGHSALQKTVPWTKYDMDPNCF